MILTCVTWTLVPEVRIQVESWTNEVSRSKVVLRSKSGTFSAHAIGCIDRIPPLDRMGKHIGPEWPHMETAAYWVQTKVAWVAFVKLTTWYLSLLVGKKAFPISTTRCSCMLSVHYTPSEATLCKCAKQKLSLNSTDWFKCAFTKQFAWSFKPLFNLKGLCLSHVGLNMNL